MTRPVSILIAALGGEGGGVLTNWIVAAAHAQGLPVQATSIPGVAQRTGATTYYVEIWPEPVSGRQPALALSPAPGEVDVVVASELLEAGRCIHNGFVTPDRTHLIASTHRVYTTLEKMAAGDGRFDDEAIVRAAWERAHSTRLLNLEAVAHDSRSRINAVLLGVMAASGQLPLAPDAMRTAIGAGGKAVDANLRGFDAGLAAAESSVETKHADELPTAELMHLAVKRLTAYQDATYAGLYQSRLEPFLDGDLEVLREVARGLARRMAYEDIIRVAQLKTRPGRLAGLRAQAGAGEEDVVEVREYFRPGLGEVCDILPGFVARPLLAMTGSRARPSWALSLATTSVSGYLLLKLLAGLRPLRRISHRFAREQDQIEAWLQDVAQAAARDLALGLEAARAARLIKGYGDTHARGEARFARIRDDLLRPALDGAAPREAASEIARARAAADAARTEDA